MVPFARQTQTPGPVVRNPPAALRARGFTAVLAQVRARSRCGRDRHMGWKGAGGPHRPDGVLNQGQRAAPGVRAGLHGVNHADKHRKQPEHVRHGDVSPQASLALPAHQQHADGVHE
jgi:hypothetical protein